MYLVNMSSLLLLFFNNLKKFIIIDSESVLKRTNSIIRQKEIKAVRIEGKCREKETIPYSKIKNANRGKPCVILSNRIKRPI